jgi:hypothetical protein
MLLLLFAASQASVEELMYRPWDFDEELQVREHYLSLLYHKIPGEYNYTLINQGRVSLPEQTTEEKNFPRIDGANRFFAAGAPVVAVNLAVYLDDDIEELGRLLGSVRPPGGWTGSEVIQLDHTKVADLKVVNFDGTDYKANVLFTEYINGFRPTLLSPPLDADGDVRIVELSGSAVAYYIIPRPGL